MNDLERIKQKTEIVHVHGVYTPYCLSVRNSQLECRQERG